MENFNLNLLKPSGASPERRTAWLLRLVVALAIVTLAPQGAMAWSNLQIRGEGFDNASWTSQSVSLNKDASDTNGNAYYGVITANASQIKFKLYTSNDGGKTWGTGDSDTDESDAVSGGYNFSMTNTGSNSGAVYFASTSGTTYQVLAEYDNGWTLTIQAMSNTDTYTVTGSATLTGSDADWVTNDPSGDMTYNSDTKLYEKTFTNVSYSSDYMYEFKVVKNHAWGMDWPSSNKKLTSTEFSNGAGLYDVKITFNPLTGEINVTCTQTASTQTEIGRLTLVGDWTNWTAYVGKEMEKSADGNTFSVKISGGSKQEVYFRLDNPEYSEKGLCSTQGNGTVVEVNGDAVAATVGTPYSNTATYKFDGTKYSAVTVTAAYANNAWTVKVTADDSDERKYYAVNYGTSGTIKGSQDGDVVTFSIPQVANTADGLEFTIGEATSSTDATIATKWGTSNDSENVTSGMDALTLSPDNSTTTFKLPASTAETAPAGTVTLKLNVSTGELTASWTTNADEATKDLYLVLRKQGGTWYSHKMVYTRNRQTDNSSADAGENNDKYQNYNIRKDDLEKYIGLSTTSDDYTVEWYVRTGKQSDGTYTYYYPSTTIDFTSGTYQAYSNGTYETYYLDTPTSTTNSSDTYDPQSYYTFSKSDGASYTFTFNKPEATDGVQAGFAVNKAIASYDDDQAREGYYLIGDFTGTNASQHTNDRTHPMKRYYYKNGIAYEHGTSGGIASDITSSQWLTYINGSTTIQPDSIVYRAHIDKPTAGWGNLYIMPNPADNATDANADKDWGSVLRPQINRASAAIGSGYQLDGIALNGGLTNYNVNQSLNPNMADALTSLGLTDINDIPSYDFSMNITTATYRLVFNKPLPSGKLVLRDYGDVKYTPAGSTKAETRTVAGNGKYRFFRTYYSSDSYTLPDNVDMFAVTEFGISDDKATTTAVLTKLTPVEKQVDVSGSIETKQLIYANTPLVLAYAVPSGTTDLNSISGAEYTPQSGNDLAELSFTVNKFDEAVEYTGDRSPYFIGTNDAIALPQWYAYTDKNNKAAVGYHYLFGCYRRSAWNTSSSDTNIFDLGFWLSTGKKNTYANSAYLELPAELIAEQYLGTSYDMTSATGYSSAKKVPALFLVWDDGDNHTTGITDVTDKTVGKAATDAWYTLQGVRVSRPSAHGVYIHNGKKVIVK